MPHLPTAALALILLLQASPARAGDVLAGKTEFERQCASCHRLSTPDGEVLAGRRARIGPNLFGVVGSPAARVEDFTYSSALTSAAKSGLIWTEDALSSYLADPTAYLRRVTGDAKARSRMAWTVNDPADAANIQAFLGSLQ